MCKVLSAGLQAEGVHSIKMLKIVDFRIVFALVLSVRSRIEVDTQPCEDVASQAQPIRQTASTPNI